MSYRSEVDDALSQLGERFASIDWTYHEVKGRPQDIGTEETFHWRTSDDEDVAICVFRGKHIHERFHRQSYFFFNYAYDGDYDALSRDRYNRITVHEGELYVSQPFGGYALRGNPDREITIVGVLIRAETFYREFLPQISVDDELLRFYVDPICDAFADSFRHLHPSPSSGFRELIELMAVEYARRGDGSQQVLKSMALALAQMAARQLRVEAPRRDVRQKPSDAMVGFIRSHMGNISLKGLAREFGYHPNYVSTLLSRETGATFREHVASARMDGAVLLLERTDMTVEEVAGTVGYASVSNFHKAYRKAFGTTPRGNRGCMPDSESAKIISHDGSCGSFSARV